MEEKNSLTDEMIVKAKSVYKYDKNRILKYEHTSYNYREEENFYLTYDFEYDSNNKLKKIIYKGIDLKTQREPGNRISEFEYDKNNHVSRITVKFVDKSEIYISEYSNYDEYGNWHNVKTYYQGKLSTEINRTIKYRNCPITSHPFSPTFYTNPRQQRL